MTVKILVGDWLDRLRELPDESVQCVVTSPPYYGLRDYGQPGQLGLEPTPAEYVAKLVEGFREVRRVLRADGVVFLNLGDSYANSSGQGASRGNPARSTLTGGGGRYRNGSKHEWMYENSQPVKLDYGSLKSKDLIGIPWRVAFALQADGWWLRQDIIWHKPNPMPESVTDRCTKAHEYVFLLTKSARYYWDQEAVKEPALYSGITGMDGSGFKPPQSFNGKHSGGSETLPPRTWIEGKDNGKRNRRSVWTIATQPYSGAHFATMPPALAEVCVRAGSTEGDTILDPFGGAGTTGLVADRLGRDAILIELNPEYAELARSRIMTDSPLLASVEVSS